jgi:hypothetical protein
MEEISLLAVELNLHYVPWKVDSNQASEKDW